MRLYSKQKSLKIWKIGKFLKHRVIHLVSTQKSSEKLAFLSPWYSHVRTCAYQRGRNVTFSETFAYVLNEWPPSVLHTSIKKAKVWLL